MIKTNDRVYHKKKRANGIVIDIISNAFDWILTLQTNLLAFSPKEVLQKENVSQPTWQLPQAQEQPALTIWKFRLIDGEMAYSAASDTVFFIPWSA